MPRVEWRPHECVALKVWVFTGCADRDSTTWTRAWVLREHDMLVSGVDWHAGTNRIVTCSHDRNAFVWSLDAAANVWRPQVVLLRVNRAAMGVRWSPDGARFAVASSNKHAVVCTFEPANNWWVGRAAQKAKSTVTAVSWHPSGVAVASSSTDYRVRVTSVADGGGGGAPSTSIFGPLPAFGTELCEFEETRAWINDCAWSPSGRQLAFVGHDGLLHVVAFDAAAAAPPAIQTVKTAGLPANRVLWLTDASLVTAGHNMTADMFSRSEDSGAWAFTGALGAGDAAPVVSASAASASAFGSARALFAAKAVGGTKGGPASASGDRSGPPGGGGSDAATPALLHRAAITDLRPHTISTSGDVTSFSTSGTDGRVVLWTVG